MIANTVHLFSGMTDAELALAIATELALLNIK